MTTQTILFDIDGVLGLWEEQFVTDFRRLFPHLPTADAGTRERFNMFTGDQEYDDAIRFVMNDSGFYARMEPTPGGREAVEGMAALGFDIAFCSTPTHTNPTCASDKYDWVTEHFGSHWADQVNLTHDKTRVIGDILIDDKDVITGSRIPTWRQVFFTQKYNEHLTDRLRINNWSEWRPVIDSIFPGIASK